MSAPSRPGAPSVLMMLIALREHLDTMEEQGDDRSHGFVEGLLIQIEEADEKGFTQVLSLSEKQYEWLYDLWDKYCN